MQAGGNDTVKKMGVGDGWWGRGRSKIWGEGELKLPTPRWGSAPAVVGTRREWGAGEQREDCGFGSGVGGG